MAYLATTGGRGRRGEPLHGEVSRCFLPLFPRRPEDESDWTCDQRGRRAELGLDRGR